MRNNTPIPVGTVVHWYDVDIIDEAMYVQFDGTVTASDAKLTHVHIGDGVVATVPTTRIHKDMSRPMPTF